MDAYSYHCGVIDAFNEIVKAGVKRLALSHPIDDEVMLQRLAEFSKSICAKYKTQYYIEKELLITDLFPKEANSNTYSILYYKDKEVLTTYLSLKETKKELLLQQQYTSTKRKDIAYQFGKLLSYSDTAIIKLIQDNQDKE